MKYKVFLEKIILGIAFVSLMSQQVFAVTNPLLDPRKKNSTIIDVGYNNGTAPVAASIPKEMINIPALLREINQNILVKERNHDTYDCRFDGEGNKACPVDSMQCSGGLMKDRGISTRVEKQLRIPKQRVSTDRSNALNPNEMFGDYKILPNYGQVNGSTFVIQSANTVTVSQVPTAQELFNAGWQINGKFAMKVFNFGSGGGGIETNVDPSSVQVLENSGSTIYPAVNDWLILSDDSKYATILATWNTIPSGQLITKCDDYCLISSPNSTAGFWNWGCPTGYTLNGDYCDLNYAYYNYSCPETTGTPWTLLNEGGDCNGVGLNSNRECNSQTPPNDNCVRTNYVCPVGDERNECSKKASSNSLAENLFEGYLYRSGTVEHNSTKLVQPKICPNQNNICDGISKKIMFFEDLNNPGTCIAQLEYTVPEVNGGCKPGMSYNASKNICYTTIEGAIINTTEMRYEVRPVSKYNASLKRCEVDMEYVCSEPGFVYDEVIGECVGEYQCNGYWNSLTGKCEVAPEIECDLGYQYNVATMRCEAEANCLVGSLSENSNTFQCESNNFGCLAGWQIDSSGNECHKPMVTVNPICPESFQSWNSTLHICEGNVNLNNWSAEDPWDTAEWTLTGGVAKQLLNSTMPTFFVSNKKFSGVSVKGKVYIDSTSNDNDSVGIVFSYVDSAEYYVVNWQKDSAGSSGGTYLLSVQKIAGQTPPNQSGQSGTGGVTLGGTNTGWTYDSWNEIEIKTGLNKIEVYINGTLKTTVNNIDISGNLGRVGFFNQSQAKASYKDFSVKSLPTCISGYKYSKERDICVQEFGGYEYDFDHMTYVVPVKCNDGTLYDKNIRKCISTPTCINNGSLDYERKKCFKEERKTCNNGFSLTPGITFENCDLNAICPGNYTLNESKLLCDQNVPCAFIDADKGLCYEGESALCDSPTAVIEPSTYFHGYDIACADPAICLNTGGSGTYLGGEWKCAKPVNTDRNILCSGKVDGWTEIFCSATEVKKWESNAKSNVKGPICQPKTMFATDSSGNLRIPKQDYELTSSLTSKLPEYYPWIPNFNTMTCDKAVNVYRCPIDPTAPANTYFTEVVSNGEYTGHRGTVGIYTNIACEAPIKYAQNIWTETKSNVGAANYTCTKQTDNTVAYSHSLYSYTAGTYQCSSSGHSCTGTYGSTAQNSTSSTLAVTYNGSPTCTIPNYTYSATGTLNVDTNVTTYSCPSGGTLSGTTCTVDPNGSKTCSSTSANTKTETKYYDYTAGTFKCVNNATQSSGSGSGSLGNMSGAATTSCTGTFGTTTLDSTSNTNIVAYNSSTMQCSLYDNGNFTWTETCPAGYVFNTEPNGAITAIPSGSRIYSQRYSSSSANFNVERCYKVNSTADITYFDKDKYLVREFPIVTEYWSDYGETICNTPGLDWDSSLNRCVGPRDTCNGHFEESDGKCEKQIKEINCSAGYHYEPLRQRCESNLICPSGGVGNKNDLTCELKVQDACANQHISGHDFVCATNAVCSANSTQSLINGQYQCKSPKELKCPEGYQPDISGNKCVAPAHCAEGYTEKNGQCELTYNWSKYGCASGWTGPIDPGLDCKGSCGYDGCWCNGENSPANNCKQAFNVTTGADSFELFEKRRLEYFYANPLSAINTDYGEFKNFECGENCSNNYSHIYGEGNKLCFEKNNKELSCFEVNNCYFSGEITGGSCECPGNFPIGWIKDMYVQLLGRCPDQAGYNHWLNYARENGITTRESLKGILCQAARENNEPIQCIDDSIPASCPNSTTPKGEIDNLILLDSHTLTSTSAFGGIVSTCKMNGHVGWVDRKEGISAISSGSSITRYSVIEASGSGTFNKDWQNAGDLEGRTEWNGFNIGTMALQLSDGNWYVSSSFKNKDNIEIERKMPNFVQKLDNSFYQFDANSSIGLNCFYKGNDMNSSCSNSFKVIMPDPKLSLIGISDIESLFESSNPLHISGDNEFNMQMIVGDLNVSYIGSNVITPLQLSNTTVQDGNSSMEKIFDRLLFWDSYKDKNIGFIEFVRDVKDSDRLDNFVPENQIPYEMAKLGFTSIDYSSDYKKTYFVKPTQTSNCQSIASTIGGTVFSNWDNIKDPNFGKYIGSTRLGSCTIVKDTKESFGLLSWAVRKNIYRGNFTYECSPYICDNGGSCDIATCPTETSTNGSTIEYFGNILPASYSEPGCRNQICDGNKEFINYCGRNAGCDQNMSGIVFENNHCYELYCNEGALNTDTKTCTIERCPVGSIPATDGSCKK